MVEIHPDLYVAASTYPAALNKLAEIYIAGEPASLEQSASIMTGNNCRKGAQGRGQREADTS